MLKRSGGKRTSLGDAQAWEREFSLGVEQWIQERDGGNAKRDGGLNLREPTRTSSLLQCGYSQAMHLLRRQRPVDATYSERSILRQES